MKRVTTCYLSISIPANEENNSNLTLNEFLTKVKRNTPIHYFSCHENTPSHTTLEGMSASSWAHESPTQPYNKDLHTENCTYTFAVWRGDKGSSKSVKYYIMSFRFVRNDELDVQYILYLNLNTHHSNTV